MEITFNNVKLTQDEGFAVKLALISLLLNSPPAGMQIARRLIDLLESDGSQLERRLDEMKRLE